MLQYYNVIFTGNTCASFSNLDFLFHYVLRILKQDKNSTLVCGIIANHSPIISRDDFSFVIRRNEEYYIPISRFTILNLGPRTGKFVEQFLHTSVYDEKQYRVDRSGVLVLSYYSIVLINKLYYVRIL